MKWRHRDDTANEKGVDLAGVRYTDKHTGLVSVKKHPVKDALAQMVELEGHHADERIYVYTCGASQSFRDNMKRFESRVQFRKESEPESRLNESGLTLWLKTVNTKAERAIFRIMKSISSIIEDRPLGPPPSEPGMDIYETLWAMKDQAVTVYRCSGMAHLLFEDPNKLGELKEEQVQRLVVFFLDYLYAYGLLSLEKAFRDLAPELRSLLHHVYRKTRSRPNWLELWRYNQGPVPGNVLGLQ